MVEHPLSARDLGIEVSHHAVPIPVITELLVSTGKVFPTAKTLGLAEGSIFSRIYDTSRIAELEDKGLDTDEIAAIAFEEEIRLGKIELPVISKRVRTNITVQGVLLRDKTGIGYKNIPTEGRRKGKYRLFYDVEGEFTPLLRRGSKSTDENQHDITGVILSDQEGEVRNRELFSHPENIGEEGSQVRIVADLLFSRALTHRSSSRELLLEDFTSRYLHFHPGTDTVMIRSAFDYGLVLLEKKLIKIDSAFQIPNSKRHHKDAIVKIGYNPPAPIEKQENKIQQTPDIKTPDPSEKEGEEIENPIDLSVFGQSKTTLLRYLLNSGKPRSLEHIAMIRRKEGKTGPLQADELADTKMVLSTLQLELPEGVELRNPVENNGKVDTTKFELYPHDLSIQQVIELKKQKVEAARIAKEAEQQRIIEENAALETERLERFERMRTEALAAKAEREASEKHPIPEPEIETEQEEIFLDIETILLDILKDEGITLKRGGENDGQEGIEEEKNNKPDKENARLTELKESGILDVVEAAASADGVEPSLASAARIIIPENRSNRDVPTRHVQMKPGTSQKLTPKKPETLKGSEIVQKDGKIEMSKAHLEIFSTLMSISESNGIKPRDIAQIITKGKAKGDIIPATERRLKELMEAFKGTPIKITHPIDEFGVVDDRRFILNIPEGVNPLHYISVRS